MGKVVRYLAGALQEALRPASPDQATHAMLFVGAMAAEAQSAASSLLPQGEPASRPSSPILSAARDCPADTYAVIIA